MGACADWDDEPEIWLEVVAGTDAPVEVPPAGLAEDTEGAVELRARGEVSALAAGAGGDDAAEAGAGTAESGAWLGSVETFVESVGATTGATVSLALGSANAPLGTPGETGTVPVAAAEEGTALEPGEDAPGEDTPGELMAGKEASGTIALTAEGAELKVFGCVDDFAELGKRAVPAGAARFFAIEVGRLSTMDACSNADPPARGMEGLTEIPPNSHELDATKKEKE